MSTMTFINLPVKKLAKTTEFVTKLRRVSTLLRQMSARITVS
jgi:predicted lactoylglutathione lyase